MRDSLGLTSKVTKDTSAVGKPRARNKSVYSETPSSPSALGAEVSTLRWRICRSGTRSQDVPDPLRDFDALKLHVPFSETTLTPVVESKLSGTRQAGRGYGGAPASRGRTAMGADWLGE